MQLHRFFSTRAIALSVGVLCAAGPFVGQAYADMQNGTFYGGSAFFKESHRDEGTGLVGLWDVDMRRVLQFKNAWEQICDYQAEVKIDYEGPQRSPLAQGLIAFAGPCASALLAVVLLAVRLSVGGNDVDGGLASVLTFGIGTNALITVVNLLPFPTLDGGQIVRSLWSGLSRGREHA